jgi:hypothetical protein
MDTGVIIVITVVVTAIIASVAVTAFYEKDRIGALAIASKRSSIPSWLMIMYYFLPYTLFLFGVINDGITRKPQYALGSVAGLAAIFINSIISKFVGGGANEDDDICGIPGMRFLSSHIFPQNIVFNLSVLSYIASIATIQSPSNLDETLPGWSIVGVLFLIHGLVFQRSGCEIDKATGVSMWYISNFYLRMLFTLLYSILFGGGFAALAAYVVNPNIRDQNGGSGGGGGGGGGLNQCHAIPGSTDDGDSQFVCEAYKNGELITSTIVE